MIKTISISKDVVYEEVAQTTSYVGAKTEDNGEAYARIFTTDNDKPQLDRFWDESYSSVCNTLKEFLIEESYKDGEYELQLNFSNSFDENLMSSVQNSIFSFFVMSIASKWYKFTNKEEVEAYGVEANAHLRDVMRMVLHKRKPIRPIYN